jgi:hypothetical protein
VPFDDDRSCCLSPLQTPCCFLQYFLCSDFLHSSRVVVVECEFPLSTPSLIRYALLGGSLLQCLHSDGTTLVTAASAQLVTDQRVDMGSKGRRRLESATSVTKDVVIARRLLGRTVSGESARNPEELEAGREICKFQLAEVFGARSSASSALDVIDKVWSSCFEVKMMV